MNYSYMLIMVTPNLAGYGEELLKLEQNMKQMVK